MIYGYARVSTDGQSLDTQVKQLRAAGAQKVLSGNGERRADRPPPIAAAPSASLPEGDVLSVTRLDDWRARPATS